MVVDLPAPLGPSRPNNSPPRISRSSPSTAANDPYSTRSPSSRIIGWEGEFTESRRPTADDTERMGQNGGGGGLGGGLAASRRRARRACPRRPAANTYFCPGISSRHTSRPLPRTYSNPWLNSGGAQQGYSSSGTS